MKSKGLGDTIDKITTATGIKSVVNGVAKVTKKRVRMRQEKRTTKQKIPICKQIRHSTAEH